MGDDIIDNTLTLILYVVTEEKEGRGEARSMLLAITTTRSRLSAVQARWVHACVQSFSLSRHAVSCTLILNFQ